MKIENNNIKDLYIFDDVVPKEQQDFLEDYMLGSKLKWIFVNDITFNRKRIKEKKITKLTPAINNTFVYLDDDATKVVVVNPDILKTVQPVLFSACAKANLTPQKILMARSFISFPLNASLNKNHNNPHIDLTIPHMVCLYYVNDTDGDTHFFDKTLGEVNQDNGNEYKETNFNIIKKVAPKKGRVVIFNGERYHSSSGPTKNVRCIINFDFTI